MTQYFNEAELRYDKILMFRAIRAAVADVHISQSLYKEVANNKDKYLGKRDSMRSVIGHLSNHKKQSLKKTIVFGSCFSDNSKNFVIFKKTPVILVNF